MRSWLVRLVIPCLLVTVTPALVAAEAESDFSISAQPLNAALTEAGRQAGVQILFDEALTKGLTARALGGRYTPQVALDMLLRGTNLSAFAVKPGTFAVLRTGPNVQTGGPAVAQSPAVQESGEKPGIPFPQLTVTESLISPARDREKSVRETQSTTTMKGEELRHFNPNNAFDGLRLVPGVNFLFGAGGRDSSPTTIRGASGTQTPKIIDDFPSIRQSGTVREFRPSGFTNPGIGLPSIALEAVEVVRGSQGVLYGDAAEGGVFVNRIKRGRAGPPAGSFYSEGSSLSETLFMGEIGGGTREFDYYLAAKRYDLHRSIDLGPSTVTQTENTSGLAKLGWNPRPELRVEALAIGFQDAETGESELDNEIGDRSTQTLFLGVKADHQIGDRLSYRAGYTFWQEKTENDFHALTTGTSLGFGQTTSPTHLPFATVYYRTYVSDTWNHTASFGVEYSHKTVTGRSIFNNNRTIKDAEFNDLYLIHVQELRYRNDLFLNGGVRYGYFFDELGDPHHVTWQVGGAYVFPIVKSKLRASYATGFSRNTEVVYASSPSLRQLSTEQFGVTESKTWEVGVTQPLWEERVSLDLVYFELTKSGTPTTVLDPQTGQRFFVNDENSTRRGIEFYGEVWPLKTLRLVGSVAYIDTEITKSNTRPAVLGFDVLPVPKLTAGLGIDWQIVPAVRIGSMAVYQSAQDQQAIQAGLPVVNSRPAFWRWNAYAEYVVTKWLQLGLRVENIMNERDPGLTTLRDGRPTTTEPRRDPGRVVAGSVQFKF